MWTPSRAADGVISDGLAVTRRLILCEDVDERVFWKLQDPVLQGMRAPFSPARGNWELDPLMSMQWSVTATLMSVPFWFLSSFILVFLL